MQGLFDFRTRIRSIWKTTARKFLGERAGNIATVTALMIVPLIGISGLGIEVSDWWLTKRALQNATDSAAIAAATNAGIQCANNGSTWTTSNTTITCSSLATNCTSATAANYKTFDCEALATARKYGFVDGSNSVTVTAALSTVNCPDSSTGCYTVTIAKTLPIRFMRAVGLTGSETVRASAVASSPTQSGQYCIMGLGPDGKQGDDILLSGGGSKIDLGGCDTYSADGDKCNGQNGKADFGINIGAYVGTVNANACGASPKQVSLIPESSINDVNGVSYDSLNSSIPADTCGGTYNQISNGTVAAANRLSGTIDTTTWSSFTSGGKTINYKIICGDAQLTAATTLNTGNGGAMLIVENGQINLNSYKLTGSGTGLTVVFSGSSASVASSNLASSSNAVNYSFQGTGTADFSAPSSGTFSGIAVYYNPNLVDVAAKNNKNPAESVDWNYTGNGYQFDLTGLIFAPKSQIQITGAINHATAGYACIGFIVDSVQVSGTGAIFPDPASQCSLAGLTLPSVSAVVRTSLIQ